MPVLPVIELFGSYKANSIIPLVQDTDLNASTQCCRVKFRSTDAFQKSAASIEKIKMEYGQQIVLRVTTIVGTNEVAYTTQSFVEQMLKSRRRGYL